MAGGGYVAEQAVRSGSARERWRAVVREALNATPHDCTDGPLGRALVLLALPMVLEMAMESLFAVSDVFFVAHLGVAAVATVGLTESLLTLVYTVAMGLSIGVTAMVARRIGERRPAEAAEAAVQAIALGVATAAIVAAAGIAFAPALLRAMGATGAVAAGGAAYTRIMLGGSATVLLLFLINAAFRGAGDPAIAMRALWLANGMNIVLGPCLIFGLGPFPRLGLAGAAVATTLGRATGVAYQLRRLAAGGSRLAVTRRHLALRPATVRALLRLSGAGTFQVLVATASYVGLVRIVAGFGSDAVAGYTIAMRVVVFGLLPAWGLANAAATLVGQSLGAGRPERAEGAVWLAAKLNAGFLAGVGLIFVVLAGPIVGVFTRDAAVAALGTTTLRIISCGFPLYALGMVLTQAFNGAGDAWTPTKINVACFWALEIPLAALLAHAAGLGPPGVYAALVVAEATLTVASAALFRRGRWRAQLV
jgi:putative MATE family efflux protein